MLLNCVNCHQLEFKLIEVGKTLVIVITKAKQMQTSFHGEIIISIRHWRSIFVWPSDLAPLTTCLVLNERQSIFLSFHCDETRMVKCVCFGPFKTIWQCGFWFWMATDHSRMNWDENKRSRTRCYCSTANTWLNLSINLVETPASATKQEIIEDYLVYQSHLVR